MDEKDKLKLENLKDDKKTFWAIFVVLTGGLAGILTTIDQVSFSLNFIIKAVLFILGAFAWYLLLLRLMNITRKINKYLR